MLITNIPRRPLLPIVLGLRSTASIGAGRMSAPGRKRSCLSCPTAAFDP